MKIRISGFELELDDDWVLADDLVPIVAHDSQGAELVVSVVIIDGDEQDAVRARVLERSFAAAKEAAAHPELAIAAPLAIADQSGLEGWILLARTLDETTLFAQAIWAGTRGVGVLTLEAPNSDAALARFDRIRSSIRPLQDP